MKNIDFLKALRDKIRSADKETLIQSMDNVHHAGLFSLVISGKENGQLTRVFIAEDRIKPYTVQFHTHRYGIKLFTLKGVIKHFEAVPVASEACDITLSEWDYLSPLNGGNGLSYLKEQALSIRDYDLPIGSSIDLTVEQFHTVSCEAGSIWVVEEGGFEVKSSKVLGVPFITDGLYTPPKQFQINDKYQMVLRELNLMIANYETV